MATSAEWTHLSFLPLAKGRRTGERTRSAPNVSRLLQKRPSARRPGPRIGGGKDFKGVGEAGREVDAPADQWQRSDLTLVDRRLGHPNSIRRDSQDDALLLGVGRRSPAQRNGLFARSGLPKRLRPKLEVFGGHPFTVEDRNRSRRQSSRGILRQWRYR